MDSNYTVTYGLRPWARAAVGIIHNRLGAKRCLLLLHLVIRAGRYQKTGYRWWLRPLMYISPWFTKDPVAFFHRIEERAIYRKA